MAFLTHSQLPAAPGGIEFSGWSTRSNWAASLLRNIASSLGRFRPESPYTTLNDHLLYDIGLSRADLDAMSL